MERRPLLTQLGARSSVAAEMADGMHPKPLGSRDLEHPGGQREHSRDVATAKVFGGGTRDLSRNT